MLSEKKKARFEFLCEVMKEVSGLDPLKDTRKHEIVSVRAMVAYQLMSEGYTCLAVAQLLGRNHSTVLKYKDRWLALFMPGWEAEREVWERFKEAIRKDIPQEV